MGECGCGATDLLATMPGPDGITYGIEVYPGCHYCDTPVGVVIHRMPADSDFYDALLGAMTPEAKFHPYDALGEGAGELSIHVFDVEHMDLETSEVYDLLDGRSMRRRATEAVRRSLSVNPEPDERSAP